MLEVSLLSQYQASPGEGHLEQELQIFTFLKRHQKLTLYMSPELPCIDYGDFRLDVRIRQILPKCLQLRRVVATSITCSKREEHLHDRVC